MTQQEKQVNYMGPFITMVFLFFIVGFLTTANTQFQGPLKETFLAEVGGLKNTFATLITFSWFLAYPICGRVGSSWISKYGYKGTLMRGLLVMVVGLGLFFAPLILRFSFRKPTGMLEEMLFPVVSLFSFWGLLWWELLLPSCRWLSILISRLAM